MVEAANVRETKAQIGERTKERFKEIFSTFEQHELKITEDNGNLEVRQSWDTENNVMKVFGKQRRVEGLVPDDFRPFFENYEQHGAAANDSVEMIEKLCTDSEGFDMFKCHVHAPWPISNRIMFSTRFMWFSEEEGHMLLFCSDQNEDVMADETKFTAQERKKMVVAICYCTGWWVKPIKDESGAVVATEMLFLNNTQAGGMIPQWVQNSLAPRTAEDSIKGTVQWAQTNKQR